MGKHTKTLQVIKKGALATLLWGGTALGSLFILSFVAIQIPYVQTRLVKGVTEFLAQKTGHEIQIGYVNISWFDNLVLEEFLVEDSFDSTMIRSNEVMIDFNLFDLITKDEVTFDAVKLTNSGLYLQKVHDSTALNLTHFIRTLRSIRNKERSSGSSDLFIGKIKFENASLAVKDHRRGKASVPWNYNDIHYENIDCSISGLRIQGDTIRAKIDQLSAIDDQKELDIVSLKAMVSFNDRSLTFRDLYLETGHSKITDSVSFIYSSASQLSFMKDSVDVEARFAESFIHPHDIQLFSTAKVKFDEPFKLSGILRGKLDRFRLTDLRLDLGKQSHITGDIHMVGLPNIQETFMDIDLTEAVLFGDDVKEFTPSTIYPYLDSLGKVEAKASFLGFYSDFVANGSFKTGLGDVQSNLNLKLPFKRFPGSYSGQIKLANFDLGRLIATDDIKKMSMSGAIDGQGFTQRSADFYLNADFESLGYKSYDYKNISTNAEFAAQFFSGQLEIDDPNLKFNIDGTVDLRNNLNKVDFSGNLDTLNLKALNVTDRDIFLRTELNLDFIGLELDSISGFVDLNDLYIRNEDRDLSLDSLLINSSYNDQRRSLTVQNELLNFRAKGKYSYTTVIKDLDRLWKEYRLILNNEKDSINAYYDSKQVDEIQNYSVDLNLSVSDADPFVRLFTDQITLGKNTNVSGQLIHGETSIFKLNSNVDTLLYKDYLFYNNEFDLNVSKLTESQEVLSMLYVSSEKQVASKFTSFNDFFMEAIWNENRIDFITNIQQTEQENKARLIGDLTFTEDAYVVSIQPSELVAIGRKWDFSEGNSLSLTKNGTINFTNFGLHFEDQSISLNGELSRSESKELLLDVTNFQLDNINPLISQKLSGVINTKANITGWGDQLLVQSDLDIRKIELDNFLIGDIKGISEWENAYKRLRLGFEIDRLNRKVTQVGGYFYPGEKIQLDMVANLDGTSLKVIEPFVSKTFSNIEGEMTGQFTIEGNLNYPILQGSGTIEEGKVKVNYLNTDYTFNGDIIFEENEVGVRNLLITDVNNNKATATGGIFHDGFKNFVLDIGTNLEKFQVLNTSSSDNDLYYGTAYLTGDVNFLGSFNNLQISAKTTTNRGTRMFIPLGNTSNVEQEEFIKFISISESVESEEDKPAESPLESIKLKGIKLDFDLDITPDAYTELIFDIKSGDIIRGRGNGKINLQINTDGDFLMFGDLIIENGGYNFTLKNIINKEFDLIEGSKISWYGDPYQGVMDIQAEYRQLTSLLPLLEQNPQPELLESADARRKYPAIVELDLKGPLLTPEIDFDIRIEDYPESIAGYSVGPMVNAFNSKLDSDEQELKRQVFSLIVLRRFSPQNSFNVGGGQTLGSSVSEFVSNQLSYWVSQVDENLEIDVDLTSLDQDAFNTFQLRLAYTFLDGRLKVSRDGGFTNVENEADISTVVGDWTVEYLITSDGKLRAKMYNKTNYNVVDRALGDQNNTTTGFSIRYTKSFDQFRELLFKARKTPKLPKEDSDPQKKEAISPPQAPGTDQSDEEHH